jgi:plastocyanin
LKREIKTIFTMAVVMTGLLVFIAGQLRISSIQQASAQGTAVSIVTGASSPNNKIFFDPTKANVKVGATVM